MSSRRLVRMILTLNLPAFALVVLAGMAELAIGRLSEAPMFGGIVAGIIWMPGVLLGGAAAAALVAVWRYWRWERGSTPTCSHCDGFLGIERDGRYGPYRRCFACGKNEPARTYV